MRPCGSNQAPDLEQRDWSESPKRKQHRDTPVNYLIQSEEERMKYMMDLEIQGDHLRICHTDGFIDIDCGCGHSYPIKALACIRL